MEYEKFVELINKCPAKKTPYLVYDTGYGDKTLLAYRSHSPTSIVTYEDSYRYIVEQANFNKIKSVLYIKGSLKTKMNRTTHDKSPKTKARHVGIELEFISKLSEVELQALLADADLEKNVTLKDDGSINTTDSYPYAHEICILGSEKTIYKLVHKVCEVLRGNSRVNKSCGMHVHLDMRSRNVDQAYANLWACQPLLYSMCPPSRINGGYSSPVKMFEEIDFEDDGWSDARYVGVNRLAYQEHETLEIRIHSGTVNEDKIVNWVKLLIKIADKPVASKHNAELITNYKALKRKLGLRGKLQKYVAGRIAEFKEDHDKRGKEDFRVVA